MAGSSAGVPSLPPPRPKSPPEYPDLYGKRRELAKVQMLEREISFLEVRFVKFNLLCFFLVNNLLSFFCGFYFTFFITYGIRSCGGKLVLSKWVFGCLKLNELISVENIFPEALLPQPPPLPPYHNHNHNHPTTNTTNAAPHRLGASTLSNNQGSRELKGPNRGGHRICA